MNSKEVYVFATDIKMVGKLDYYPKEYNNLGEINDELLGLADSLIDNAIKCDKYKEFKNFFYNSVVFKFDKVTGDRVGDIYPAYNESFKPLMNRLNELDKNVRLIKKASGVLKKEFGINLDYQVA